MTSNCNHCKVGGVKDTHDDMCSVFAAKAYDPDHCFIFADTWGCNAIIVEEVVPEDHPLQNIRMEYFGDNIIKFKTANEALEYLQRVTII